jgi:hypothetical protein
MTAVSHGTLAKRIADVHAALRYDFHLSRNESDLVHAKPCSRGRRIHDTTAAPTSTSDNHRRGWSGALSAATPQQLDLPSTTLR